MDSLLSNYDENENFWKLYPTFKVPKVCKDFYNSDKSKNKSLSSLIMWALMFRFDKTSENPYKNLSSEERIQVINDDVLNNVGFDWEPYDELVKEVHKLSMNEIERAYYALVDKFDQRLKLIQDSVYTLETATSLDKIIKDTESVRKEIDNLRQLVEQQETHGKTKGEIILSATEKGDI